MIDFPQDFSILLRFSLLFKRSTRLLCIFSSIFANRSRSSFAARLVLIASTRRCTTVSFSTSCQVSQKRTCRSVSFSSFSSFSLALTAASAFLSTVRLSHDVWLARGLNAVLLSCHCLPKEEQISCETLTGSDVWRRTILLHSLDGAHCIRSRRPRFYRFRHVESVMLLHEIRRTEDLEHGQRKKSPAGIDSSATLTRFRLPREHRQAMIE
jgi:hypothetical protein